MLFYYSFLHQVINYNDYVFLEKERIIGYYIALIAQDQCELFNITVKKNNQNLGVGNFILKHLISFCKSHKVVNMFLEVRASNFTAIKLYEKNGFKKVGKTMFGDLPGIIMKKSKSGKSQKGGWQSANKVESLWNRTKSSLLQTGGWGGVKIDEDIENQNGGGGEAWSDMSNI